MLSPEQRSHYVMLSRFGSARSLRLRTFVFAMVLLAGDAIPEPPCSGPGLQLLEAVCLCQAIAPTRCQEYWPLRLSYSGSKSRLNASKCDSWS